MFARRLFSTSSSSLPPTIRQILASNTHSTPVQVNGWIKSIRKQAKVAFAVVTDGSSSQTLQAVFTKDALAEAKNLTNGACVRLNGTLAKSIGPGQDVELQVDKVECLGECTSEEYPIQKKSLNTDYLRDHCNFRARTDSIAAMLRLRSSTLRGLQQYFESQEFCYAHTPIITSNDSEGGGETFSVTPSAPATSSTAPAPHSDFFGRPAYLTVSSQLHLEALAASISRVYTISPCFRAERSQTSRHLSEFWMLEAEWAFTNSVEDVTRVVEGAVRSVMQAPSVDLQVLWKDMDPVRLEALRRAVESDVPWARITYTQAVEELQKHSSSFKVAAKWGDSLRSEHEQWLAERLIGGPVFVTDYPASMKPFYMRLNDDGKTVACFDLLVPHVGELAGGSLREERLELLKDALRKAGLREEEYAWYVELRKFGGAPHGGFGLGFERLIRWMSGIENVRECIAMPRWEGRMLL
ncbi:hypothetical protein BXZ70DRAFT_390000 [Cristinia sonorae]|uniref:Asparagine--tRNA ligase, mitochondrial n=1 Tax=Cristinia sonorae TaxID=1940300 RepID=A0A8K0UI60_9AGAR|nr:hypothetical protein BXZ70DRAFT_390000 [Cristinia sonorae]